MEVKIGLIGCGTVGRGLLEILEKKRTHLKSAYGFEARIVAISDKLKGSILVPDGIEIDRLFALLDGGGRIDQYYGEGSTAELLNPLDLIEQCDAEIIAELTYTDIKTGEPATGYIKKALRSGMHVVTSNKGPAALHYKELSGLAHKNGLVFRIEGTVMSGTPVFSLVRERTGRQRDPRGQGHPQRHDQLHPDQDGAGWHGIRRRPGPRPEAGLRRGRPDGRRRGLRRAGQGRHPVQRPAGRGRRARRTSRGKGSRP